MLKNNVPRQSRGNEAVTRSQANSRTRAWCGYSYKARLRGLARGREGDRQGQETS
ncbi:MAG: hypothetical protein GDA43_19075 [Hormoscilla sp. SP5CHS1]|nr:hypothetical protein [Hormoscilla sp. SP12CHS1]MBC6455045.1 hypothetical protein [Hormoscilla sp. SP5CHS1]